MTNAPCCGTEISYAISQCRDPLIVRTLSFELSKAQYRAAFFVSSMIIDLPYVKAIMTIVFHIAHSTIMTS